MQATELLKQTPLLQGLGDTDIEELAQSTRIQDYKAGQIIVIVCRVGAAFFILVSGSVEVIKRRGQSDEAVVAILQAGDFFGELATMRHVPRSASVRALQDSRCLVIRRADFEAYMSKFPDVVARVESTLTSRFGQVPDLDD
jgi:CRP-like cAMP-binding protein